MGINLNDGMTGWLKQDDIPKPVLVTITNFEFEKVDEAKMPKLVVYFKEFHRGLILNNTNIEAIKECCGSPDAEKAIGTQIVLYSDPNVMFGSKKVGGLRLRKPKPQATQQDKKEAERFEQEVMVQQQADDDDIPF